MPVDRQRRWVIGMMGGLTVGAAGCTSVTDDSSDSTTPNEADNDGNNPEGDGSDESTSDEDEDDEEPEPDSEFVKFMRDMFSGREALINAHPGEHETLQNANEEIGQICSDIAEAEELTSSDVKTLKELNSERASVWKTVSDAYILNERGENAIANIFDHWDTVMGQVDEYVEFDDWDGAYDVFREKMYDHVSYDGHSNFTNTYYFEPAASLLHINILTDFSGSTVYISRINHLFNLGSSQFRSYSGRYLSETDIYIPELTDNGPLPVFSPFNDIVSEYSIAELQLESGPAHFYIRTDTEDSAEMIVEEVKNASQVGDSESFTFGEYERIAWETDGGTKYGYVKQDQEYVFIGCTGVASNLWDDQDTANASKVTWFIDGEPDEIVNL